MSNKDKKLGNIIYKPTALQRYNDALQQGVVNDYEFAKRFSFVRLLKKLTKPKEDLTMDKMITSKFKGDQYKSKASPLKGNAFYRKFMGGG